MEEQPAPLSAKSLPAIAGELSAIGALLTATLYALGFIVVNSYMSRLGLRDFAIFTTSYLQAGICVLLAMAILTVFWVIPRFALLGKFRPNTRTDLRHQRIIALDAFSIVMVASMTSLLLLDDLSRPTLLLWMGFAAGAIGIGTSHFGKKYPMLLPFLATSVALGVHSYLRVEMQDTAVLWLFTMTAINIAVGEAYVALWKKVSYSRLLAWGWGILAVGGAVIIFASHFGFLFFDRVRPSLGGGFPTRIQLVLSQETSKDLNGVLPLNGNRTDPVYLIYETSSDLMIAIDLKSLEGRVIRIPRNGVAAVLGENVMQTPAPQMNMNPASGTQ